LAIFTFKTKKYIYDLHNIIAYGVRTKIHQAEGLQAGFSEEFFFQKSAHFCRKCHHFM